MTDPNIRHSVPGTEYLVDTNRSLDVSHAGSGSSDIVLLPQPTACGRDPLRWSMPKKYWQLTLLALYACGFSYGENNLGAARTVISEQANVPLTALAGGGALNYLLLGFANIFWIPLAMKGGRRPVLLITTLFVLGSMVWQAEFNGAAQWYLSCALNGVGTSAYQAVIQLSIFDMFFVHQRSTSLSFYLFGQQLGSILGLITGGAIADTRGWRWSGWIAAIIEAGTFLLILAGFEETMFPRFLFDQRDELPRTEHGAVMDDHSQDTVEDDGKKGLEPSQSSSAVSERAGEVLPGYERRTMLQRLKLWNYQPEDKTTYWEYFRRPSFLFAFPNVVLAGIIFAFGCTAGIVTFNTISEIMTAAPYNFSTTATGLMFLSALIGSVFGYLTGVFADTVVVFLARRNGGVKEPEMRLWTLCISFVYAGAGYLLYGWGAEEGLHWVAVAFGLGCMIAHQVSACSIATAYAMDSFPGISGEIVVILAICSSCINFAINQSLQYFIDATSFGPVFTFYGLMVLLSMAAAVPMCIWGKQWRKRCAPKYREFLSLRGDVQ
ncbi:hypothetical protein WHR41_04094 [Cladosporium halotolerans]|uniref:MFS transporter n=1 Tax=Cladosporium halotolerans TaxID=1052096 RepID=A0AB34KP31_9PEZI